MKGETFQSVTQSTVWKLGIKDNPFLYPYKCSVSDQEATIQRQVMGLEYL